MAKNDHIPPSLQRFVSEIIHPGSQGRGPGLLATLQAFREEAHREALHASDAMKPRWSALLEALDAAHDGVRGACEEAAKAEGEAA